MNLFGNSFPTQGGRAVRSGRYGEASCEAGFAAYRVKIVGDDPVYHHPDGGLWARKDHVLVKQYRVRKGFIIDFVYRDYARGISLPIECKQQMGGGTTDHKLAYAVDLLIDSGFPGYWLVLNGDGFNPDVLRKIDAKIRASRIKGRLLFGSMLQRAIEQLVERGKP